jgi:hypothetical protein
MDLEIANYDQTINGVLMYTAALPGLYSHLLDNQNRQQYALRTLIDNSLSKLWYPNITLKSFTSISLPSTNNLSYVFSQIYHLYCSTTSVPVYNTSTLESIAEVVGEVYYTTVYIDKVITSTISNPSVYSNGENIKIDLSDARNRDLVVEAFVDENCTVPLTANGYLVGKPGNDGAAFLYLSTVNATFKTFYLKLTRENVSIIHVNLA